MFCLGDYLYESSILCSHLRKNLKMLFSAINMFSSFLELIDHFNLKDWREWKGNLIKYQIKLFGMVWGIFVWEVILKLDGLGKNL